MDGARREEKQHIPSLRGTSRSRTRLRMGFYSLGSRSARNLGSECVARGIRKTHRHYRRASPRLPYRQHLADASRCAYSSTLPAKPLPNSILARRIDSRDSRIYDPLRN